MPGCLSPNFTFLFMMRVIIFSWQSLASLLGFPLSQYLLLSCTVLKIPWRRKWQPTPAFLPAKSHGQRSWAGYTVHGVAKNQDNFATNNNNNKTLLKLGGGPIELFLCPGLLVWGSSLAASIADSYEHIRLSYKSTLSASLASESSFLQLNRHLLKVPHCLLQLWPRTVYPARTTSLRPLPFS